jgi:Fe-S-cluster containining protein
MKWEKLCFECKKDVHCCRFMNNSGFVFVGIKTAEQIRDKTNIKFSDFLDYSPLDKQTVRNMKKQDFHLEGNMRFQLLDDENRLLRLKIEHEKCIFLNDKGRCDIYDIRPNICKIYPFWALRLIDGSLKVITHDDNSSCQIIKKLENEGGKKDMELVLSKIKIKEIKEIMKNIEKENKFYKENIGEFVSKNKLYKI